MRHSRTRKKMRAKQRARRKFGTSTDPIPNRERLENRDGSESISVPRPARQSDSAEDCCNKV